MKNLLVSPPENYLKKKMFTDGSERRIRTNKVVSITTGILVSLGIWFFADGIIQSYSINHVQFYELLPPIFVLVGFFLINNLPPHMFGKGSSWYEETTGLQKSILVISIVLLFGSTIASIWIYLGVPLFNGENVPKLVSWRGITSMIQTIITLFATFIWRFLWRDPTAY